MEIIENPMQSIDISIETIANQWKSMKIREKDAAPRHSPESIFPPFG